MHILQDCFTDTEAMALVLGKDITAKAHSYSRQIQADATNASYIREV